MKRIFYVLAAVLLLPVLFCGCKNTRTDNGKINIVATIFPPFDFARAIAGDKANLQMLLPPGSEAHSFEPTFKDIDAIKECDIFIYVGGESDEWVENILASVDTSKIQIITLIDCVEKLEEEQKEGMESEKDEEPSDEEGAAEYDEHVWTSPRNVKLIAQKISNALCVADPENKRFYENNAVDYLKQLDELDEKFKEVVQNGKRNTLIFGDRFPFLYFAKAYGLDYYAAFKGCSTQTDAGGKTIKFLIDKINEQKIPVVFHLEMGNVKLVNTIAEATGATPVLFHACHNVSKNEFNSGLTYLNLMNNNVEALRQALN